MDTARFDQLISTLSTAPSRRGILRALGGCTVLALLGHAGADAKRKKKKKKKGKQASPPGPLPPPPPPPPPVPPAPPPFCAGKNSCDGGLIGCNRDDSGNPCFCVVTASGEPFCTEVISPGTCDVCPLLGQVCLDLEGDDCPAASGCGSPCPNPL